MIAGEGGRGGRAQGRVRGRWRERHVSDGKSLVGSFFRVGRLDGVKKENWS